MPIADFQLEDGRIASFEVPEGTTIKQAQDFFATRVMQDSSGKLSILDDNDTRSVLHEESGTTVNAPWWMDGTETDYATKTQVLGEDPSSFFGMTKSLWQTPEEKIQSSLKSAAKGAVAGTAQMAANVVGGSLAEFGDTAISDLKKARAGGGFINPLAMSEDTAKAISGAGYSLVDSTNEFLKNHGLARSDEDGVAYDLGAAGASVGTSIAMTLATRSPHSAAIFFGELQKAQKYLEMKAKGISTDKASYMSTLFGIPEGAIEMIGGEYFLKFAKLSNPVTKIMARAVDEAAQEGAQQFAEESIGQVSGVAPVDIKGGIQRVLYSAAIGGLVGVPVHTVTHYIEKAAEENGLARYKEALKAAFLNNKDDMTLAMTDVLKRQASVAVSPESAAGVAEVVRKFKAGEDITIPEDRHGLDAAVREAGKAAVGHANKTPETYYHGSLGAIKDFANFISNRAREGFIFFTKDKKSAETYSKGGLSAEQEISFDNFEENNPEIVSGGKVIDEQKLWDNKDSLDLNDVPVNPSKYNTPSELKLAYEKAYDLAKNPPLNILEANLDLKNTHEKIKWQDAEKLGAKYFIDKGYDSVLIDEGNGKESIAVLNKDVIKQKKESDKPIKRLHEYEVNDRRSYRDQLYVAMGLDPMTATNMAPIELIKMAIPLFKQRFNIDIIVNSDTLAVHALDNLLDAWVTFKSFADVLGIPEKDIGLPGMMKSYAKGASDNTLKLIFSKEGGKYLGQYSSSENTLDIAGRALSFSHEWGHALDYYMLEVLGDDNQKKFRGYTRLIRAAGVSYKPDTIFAAWANVMNAMFLDEADAAHELSALQRKLETSKSEKVIAEAKRKIEDLKRGSFKGRGAWSNYRQAAAELHKLEGPNKTNEDDYYYLRPTEMFARAFEAYTSFKLGTIGASTDMLSKDSAAYDGSIKEFEKYYPQAEERFRIFMAMDELFMKMRDDYILNSSGVTDAEARVDHVQANMPQHWNKVTPDNNSGFMRRLSAWYERETQLQADAAERKARQERTGETFFDAAKSLWYRYAGSVNASLLMIRKKNPQSPALTNLINHFTVELGSGKKRTTFSSYEDMIQAKYRNLVKSTIDRLKLRPDSEEEMQALSDVVQGLPRRKILSPEREAAIKEAAYILREGIYKDLFYQLEKSLKKVGKKIGYVKDVGYMNLVLNETAILADEEKSVKILTEANAISLEEDYRDKTTGREQLIEDAESVAPRSAALRKLKEAITQGKSEEEIQPLAEDLIQEVLAVLPKIKALALIEHVKVGTPLALSASNSMTKSRTLSPRTIQLMEPLRVSSPIEAIRIYIDSSARLMAMHDTIGTKENIVQALKDASAQGVSKEDIRLTENWIADITGMSLNDEYRTPKERELVKRAITIFNSMLLGRAAFSSFAEPLTMSMRGAGITDGPVALARSFGLIKTDEEMLEVLEDSGAVSSAMSEKAFDDMFGTSSRSSLADRMNARFYENSFISVITRKQKASIAIQWNIVMRRTAKRINNPKTSKAAKDRAIANMHDWGIQDPISMSKYIESLGEKKLPSISDTSEFAQEYFRAIRTATDTTIQTVTRGSKPSEAIRKAWMYGLFGYNYAFFEHIGKYAPRFYVAEYKRLGGDKSAKAHAFAQAVLRFFPAYVQLLLGTSTAFLLKTLIFNREAFMKKTEEEKIKYIISGGISYTTPLGPVADIMIGVANGIKYHRSITTIFAGSAFGSQLQAAQDVIDSLINKNNPETNTSERKMTRALYQLLAVSASTVATATVGGWLGKAVGIVNMYIGSRDAASKATDAIAGKKKTSNDDW